MHIKRRLQDAKKKKQIVEEEESSVANLRLVKICEFRHSSEEKRSPFIDFCVHRLFPACFCLCLASSW
ncbi:hypothetical protein CHARACLAT_021197 [Characodon lateralis]|uniref:Uncharacterized protein n=1 Tax=Characodon lateralis TaxID=208331 RepID=A0ABU7ENP1_9TELE|nr:hypothetical protein [Characodon lateralis]